MPLSCPVRFARWAVCCASALVALGSHAQTAGVPDSVAVANLRAFTELYGTVRFFHPSDEAAATDWGAFAVRGVQRVVGARTPADLQLALTDLFGPVAPTVAVYPTGAEPPPRPLPPDTTGLEPVAWQHLGVGFGSSQSPYRSVRVNRATRLEATPTSPGILSRSVGAEPLRGRRVRLTAAARSEGEPVQLWLRVDRPDGAMGLFDNMGDRPVTARTWTPATIEGDVAEDAVRLLFGAIATGTASVDAFRLDVQQADGTWEPVALANGGFEAGSTVEWSTRSAGFAYALHDDAAEGEAALRIAPSGAGETIRGPLFAGHPAPGEVARVALGRGLAARVPLALYSRDGRTLGSAALPPGAPEAPAADTLATRLADVVVAWSVFEHFYPYFDVVDADWGAALAEALGGALAARGPDAHCRVLRRLVAHLDDGHGYVRCQGTAPTAMLPVAVETLEGRPTVVASHDDRLRPGDVIVSVDGVPGAEILENARALASGSPQWSQLRAEAVFGEGPAGSTAEIAIERGGEAQAVAVERAQQPLPDEARPDPVAWLRPGVAYVDLTRLDEPTLRGAIDTLATARALVVDVRGYPQLAPFLLQHLSDRPLRSARWNIPRTIYPSRARPLAADTTGRWVLPPLAPRLTDRVAFLTDARAISYAESVLGIVEAYGLGEIVGAPTAGANGNVNPFALPGGHSVSWTGMRVLKHDGSTHHVVGIRPTVPVARTRAGVRAGRDEVLERAVEIVTR